METSKDIVKKAGIIPDLVLATKRDKGGVDSTGPHTVKLLEDKVIKDTDYDTGAEIYVVRYILEEAGEKKKYDVAMKDKKGEIHYLVQRLAEIGEGEEIIMECKRHGIKNYIEIKRVNQPEKANVAEEDDIPIINENEPSDFEKQINA